MRSTHPSHAALVESIEQRLVFAAPSGLPTPPNAGDLDPPTVLAIVFDFDTPATKPSIAITFSESVQPTTFDSSAGSSFAITDRATGLAVAPGNFTLVNATPSVAVITFKGGVNAPADGDFRITVNAGNVKDLVGNSLSASASLDYSFLQCDATRDRKVNTLDFNLLAGNFGDGGRRFTQGDFNFDGNINAIDFTFLRALYGRQLPATPLPAASLFGDAMMGESEQIDPLT